jgi:hypothetical protein
MRRLAASGVGIIYISHFLEEVAQIANRITVLRDGNVVASYGAGERTIDELTLLLTGPASEQASAKAPAKAASAGGFKTLFVTRGASGSIAAIRWPVPGMVPFRKRAKRFTAVRYMPSALLCCSDRDCRSHFAGYELTALRGIMVEATGPKEHPHHRRRTFVSSAPTLASAARVRSRAWLSPSGWTGWIQT